MNLKSILILFSIITTALVTTAQNNDAFNGSWFLVKIDSSNKIIIPDSGKYFLKINETRVNYNLEVNKCWYEKSKLVNRYIDQTTGSACTEMCCDEVYGNFFKKLDYSGKYELSNDSLIIRNRSGIYYLKQ